MSLNDPFFTKFDGSPDTGRVPTRLIVLGGAGLSESQLRGVDHVYGQFRNACKLSASDFHTEQVKLHDGTIVHMWSLQNRDEVTVEPAGGPEDVEIPHGFVVVSEWNSPLFYRRFFEPSLWAWAFEYQYLPPQISDDAYGYNHAIRAAVDDLSQVVLPMVLGNPSKELWDYAPHAGPDVNVTPTLDYVIPFNTAIDGEGFDAHSTQYLFNDTILDGDGVLVYTMPATPSIIAEDAPEGPEDPIAMCGSTDSKGERIALNSFRMACIAPSANIWKFKYCSEEVRRTGVSAYSVVSRAINELTTPLAQNTTAVTNDDLFGIQENPFAEIGMVSIELAPGGVGGGAWLNPPGVTMHYSTNMRFYELDPYSYPLRNNHDEGYTKVVVNGAGSATTSLIKVGGATSVETITMVSALNYPVNSYFRAGLSLRGHWLSDYTLAYRDYYGVLSHQYDRRDAIYSIAGTPSLTLSLGWGTFTAFTGTADGSLSGRWHRDTSWRWGHFGEFSDQDSITEVPLPSGLATNDWTLYNYLTSSANIRNTKFQDLMDEWGDGQQVTYTTPVDEAISNTVSYTLTSRYIIDYDHKARFWAAIRVTVECSTVTWSQDPAGYRGKMVQDNQPTYTVTIAFESNWNGVGAEKILRVDVCTTRPPFEFMTIPKINPFYYDAPLLVGDRPIYVHMPPAIRPDENFMMQIANVAKTQGVNTHIAAQDIRDDLTAPQLEAMESTEGIEFSYLRDGFEIPHERFVTGMLYARSFKLSDFSGALWLLHSTKCDAILEDFQPDYGPERLPWYYMPELGASLDTVKYHIELRDGEIPTSAAETEYWSDDLEPSIDETLYPPAPRPKPAYVDRNIKLYSV